MRDMMGVHEAVALGLALQRRASARNVSARSWADLLAAAGCALASLYSRGASPNGRAAGKRDKHGRFAASCFESGRARVSHTVTRPQPIWSNMPDYHVTRSMGTVERR
jgi:hypothetical protein